MNCPSCGQGNRDGAAFCDTCGTTLAKPTSRVVTSEKDGLLSSGFVGRQREMGELRAALEDAMSGRGRLVMLAGEPGIGKSRAAQEIGAYAELRGSRVLTLSAPGFVGVGNKYCFCRAAELAWTCLRLR